MGRRIQDVGQRCRISKGLTDAWTNRSGRHAANGSGCRVSLRPRSMVPRVPCCLLPRSLSASACLRSGRCPLPCSVFLGGFAAPLSQFLRGSHDWWTSTVGLAGSLNSSCFFPTRGSFVSPLGFVIFCDWLGSCTVSGSRRCDQFLADRGSVVQRLCVNARHWQRQSETDIDRQKSRLFVECVVFGPHGWWSIDTPGSRWFLATCSCFAFCFHAFCRASHGASFMRGFFECASLFLETDPVYVCLTWTAPTRPCVA